MIVPPVARKAIGMPLGKKGAVKCVLPLESLVTLAVTVEVPPAVIVLGERARPNSSQGLVLTLPDALSPPVVFGPVLIPHQFNVASAWWLWCCRTRQSCPRSG